MPGDKRARRKSISYSDIVQIVCVGLQCRPWPFNIRSNGITKDMPTYWN